MVWLILGLLIGAGAWWLVNQLQTRKIQLKIYEWGILALALGLFLFGLQNLLALYGEFAVAAGWIVFAMFGVPAIILVALVAGLVIKRQPTKAVSSNPS